MLNDYVLEKFLLQEEVRCFSVGKQTEMLNVFDKLMSQIKEENANVTVSELLSKLH